MVGCLQPSDDVPAVDDERGPRIGTRGSANSAPGRSQGVDEDPGGSASTPEEGSGELSVIPAYSHRGGVKFKRQHQFKRDLINALDLSIDTVCVERGGLDCIDSVHHLTLGGVDAYNRNIYTANADSVVSTPIVVERVVLAACTERVDRDWAGESVIFDRTALDLTAAVERLYRRALARDPTVEEKKAMGAFYDELARSQGGDVSYEWARLSCLAVLTSLEFMFY